MSYEQILYSVKDGVATITMNRPDRLNAWTRLMAGEIRDAMYRSAEDNAVRVIVLTGAGRGFCSGADMDELEAAKDQGASGLELDDSMSAEQQVSILMGTKTEEELDPVNRDQIRRDFRKRFSYFLGIKKPIIGVINGPAVGLGLIMALFCDLRFASEDARFSTSFSRRGLIAEHGIGWILPRLVGLANALDLLFSSRMMDAQEAFRIGLINRIFPADDLMDSTNAYAAELVKEVSPRSMTVIKKQVYGSQFQSLAEAWADADEELILSLQSDDFKEGVNHFREKRAPQFTGK